MLLRAALLWILGLVTIVPWALYRLLFVAQRDEYAFLIVLPLFWVFGFWGVVGPIITALKIRSLLRALESAQSHDDLKRALNDPDTREAAIELLASENCLPKFLVRRIVAKLLRQC